MKLTHVIDQTGVKALQEAFPPYADKFPIFSEHASGMNQFVAWTALEAEGFGANLQVSFSCLFLV
jgi:predicted oxidoreductase (fatty acid repression mutant protein)